LAKRIITLYHAGQKLITKDQQPLAERKKWPQKCAKPAYQF